MDRRTFVGTLGGSLLAASLAAGAQSAKKIYRIGFLEAGAAAVNLHFLKAFESGLREFGYVDGNNVVINDGKAAFQSVFHIHLHVLPRQNGDKLSFAKGMLLRKDPDREESGRLLREALAELDSATQD